jgi:hypothetical protein
MKQTAVEWLIEQWPILESQIPERILEQAKEMEKEHIRSAYMDGQDDLLEHCCRQQEIHFNSLHYYQRTFKNTEQ